MRANRQRGIADILFSNSTLVPYEDDLTEFFSFTLMHPDEEMVLDFEFSRSSKANHHQEKRRNYKSPAGTT